MTNSTTPTAEDKLEFKNCAMLCIGTEEYGIGTIERIYAQYADSMLFVCFQQGALYNWLEQHNKRVISIDGPASFSLGSISSLIRLPGLYRSAKRAASHLAGILRSESIRLVHTHWLPQQLVAGYLRDQGFKSVWQINNNSRRANKIQLIQRFNHRLARWGADLLLPASDFIAKNWAACGVPMRTIHNTAPPLFDSPAQHTSGPIRCLSAGRLVHDKGHHVVTEAVIQLRRKGIDITLDIFGGPLDDNPYGEQLNTMIRDAGQEEHIRLHGYVAGMRQRHQEFDVAVQARLDPEPCSLWVCECLTDGLITFGTNTGGTPELIEDGKSGFIYLAGDAVDLQNKLEQVVNDRERMEQIRQNAFARGNGALSIRRFVQDTLDSYRTTF